MRITNNKDLCGGILMIVLGVGAISHGIPYRIGSLSRMGPGFFPVAVGAILALIGAVLALASLRGKPHRHEARLPPEWRGWFCIVMSLIAFVVLGKYGGLVPASFAVAFIAALGDRTNTLKSAFVLALAMVVVCVVVFWWGLRVQFPLFQWGG